MGIAQVDAVIVGAGTGGMATALLLARAGASVTLLEHAAVPPAVNAGILLQPNGLAILTGLGLAEPLEREGGVMTTGCEAVAVPVLAVRRDLLRHVLRNAVLADPVIDCRLGATVKNATADGCVELTWHERFSSIEADLVVGADGLRSAVRAAGSFGARVRTTHRRYVQGLVTRHRDDVDGEHRTALGVFGSAAVDDRACFFYASWAAGQDLPAFQAAWAAELPAAGRIVGRIGSFDDLVVAETDRVGCDRWHDGRLALLGNAAHAMAPDLGHGANHALVDAVVLTAELAEHPVPAALERYTRRRKPSVAHPSEPGHLRHWRSRAVSRLRPPHHEDPAALLALVTTLTRS